MKFKTKNIARDNEGNFMMKVLIRESEKLVNMRENNIQVILMLIEI